MPSTPRPRAGRPADGLGFLEEAIQIAARRCPSCRSSTCSKGDLVLALPGANGASAEPWFQQAFDIAQGLDGPSR